jgi:uncharacterized membrane protein YgcG
MREKKEKRIFVFLIAFILVLNTLTTCIVYANENLPENYIIDNAQVLSNYEIDLIDTVGKELERNGVKLIAVIEKSSEDKDINNIIKSQFFKWYGQISNSDTKLVVMNYYIDKNKILVFDDGQNYVSSQYLSKLQSNMKLYQDHNDLESGSYYLYSAIADNIARQLGVNLETSDSTLKYNKFILFDSLPALFAVLIVIVLAFSFRKRKK